MDIKKYDTAQLTFNLHKLAVPGDPTYQLVVKYDCEWIFDGMFSSEKHSESSYSLDVAVKTEIPKICIYEGFWWDVEKNEYSRIG